MTDQDIREYYDSHPNMTLQLLSRIVRKSIPDLKRILMGA